MVLGAMLATSAIAQNNTNTLPEIPAAGHLAGGGSQRADAAAGPAPAVEPKAAPVKPQKRAAVRRANQGAGGFLRSRPGGSRRSNLAVRGQAGLKGEVITHLSKGEPVTVLSQINLDKHAVGEPAHWAKIALPSTVHVWVNAKYIDGANKTVSTKQLNLRAGPGENFSVLGTLERGTPVNELETKGNWIKIEAPANACAFVAAMYLSRNAGAAAGAVLATAPAADTNAGSRSATDCHHATSHAPAGGADAGAPAIAAVDTNVPPPPRVVSHEGVVRHVGSIIAPTEYELYDPSTDKNINYLYPTIGTLI